ncbi:MAG: hypothetical protein EU548_03510 [Promethearchaeota archaeon]|nr:MAG: hypothetical protein EU548_03510 [Candidatus Lokiarchaeota archaeon]
MNSNQIKNSLYKQVRKLFQENLVKVYPETDEINTYVYISAHKEIQSQYFYNSCIHIIINCYLNYSLALKEFYTLLEIQNKNGYISPKKNWSETTQKSKFLDKQNLILNELNFLIGTPLIAFSLKRLFSKQGDINLISKTIGRIEKFYDYLYNTRIFPEDNIQLINSFQPMSKEFNEFFYPLFHLEKYEKEDSESLISMKYKDLIFNCIFIQNLRDLAYLFKEIKANKKVKLFEKRAKILEDELIKACWDSSENLFFGLYGSENKFFKRKTIFSLIPLILDNLPQNIAHKLVDDHLLNEDEFWTNYPVPFIALDDSYNRLDQLNHKSKKTYLDLNWFLIQGLLKHGFIDVGIDLISKSIDMAVKNGLYEAYNSNTGKGVGLKDFSISSIVLDIERILEEDDSNIDFIFDKEWSKIKRLPDF